MGDRGRKSRAALTIVGSDPVQIQERPAPPPGTTPERAREWVAIVNEKPANHFGREVWPVLEGYCQHAVAMRRVHQLITAAESADEFDVKEYDRLLKMHERETRCLASLGIRLGILQTTANDGKTKQGSPPPWESE